DELPRPEQVAQPAAIAGEVLVAAPEEVAALFPSGHIEGDLDDGADMAPEAAAPQTDHDSPEPTGSEDAENAPAEPPPEQIGGEPDTDEHRDRRSTPRFLRNYKIQ